MLESGILIENVNRIASLHSERLFAKLLFAQRDAVTLPMESYREAGRYVSMFTNTRAPDAWSLSFITTSSNYYAFVGHDVRRNPSIFAHPSVKSPEGIHKTLALLLSFPGHDFCGIQRTYDQLKAAFPLNSVD